MSCPKWSYGGLAIRVAISLSEQFLGNSILKQNLQFNSESIDIWMLGQKRNVFNLKLAAAMPSFNFFWSSRSTFS
jgi:hypothetical protein